ncbi:MAG: sulfatase [Thermoanaerobaculia bacterium]
MRACVFFGAALVLAACGDAPPTPRLSAATETSYTALVTDAVDHSKNWLAAEPHTCAEETHLSLLLEAGDVREFTIDVDGPVELLLAACASGPGTDDITVAPAPPAVNDRVVVRVSRGWRREEHGLAVGSGWSESRNPLALQRGQLTVRIGAEIATGDRLYVRDLAIRGTRAVERPKPAPRALLISLDAFREDAIAAIRDAGSIGGRSGPSGKRRTGSRTPVLDRLFAEAERIEPHWAAEVSTKPSHATMLTGLPVEVHGCDRSDRPLAPEIATLAERLRATGVATGAFLSIAPYFHPRFGLDQGFDSYRLEPWSTAQELREATDWIRTRADDPFFLFVHLYAAHSDFVYLPYESRGLDRRDVAREFGSGYRPCSMGLCASERLHAANEGLDPLAEGDAEVLHALYDRGVETLDADLGTFFAELEARGLWDDLLVVVTADHGEAFGEHGSVMHRTPHEEALRVPLLVKWPRGLRAGRRTTRPSTSLDLAPTILARFGVAADDLPGADLAVPAKTGPWFQLSQDAVRLGSLKLLRGNAESPRALYDLALDPRERKNLLPARERDAVRLEAARKRFLEQVAARHTVPVAPETAPFTAEELEKLRSLGYIN